MKKSIKLFAILLLLSGSLFAGVPVKTIRHKTASARSMVTFSTLPGRNGVDVKFKKGVMGNALVIIYDQDRNVLRKDVLSNKKGMQKGYVLNKLDDGDYTIEVTANKQTVKRSVHVYEEGNAKVFFVKQV